MKKLAVLSLCLLGVLTQSQAKTNPVDRALVSHKHSVSKIQMRTKNVLAHAVPRAQRRLLIANNVIDDQDDGPPGPDELDLQTSYRRPTVVDQPSTDQDAISDYVDIRLQVARARAMEKYRKKWA